MSVFERAIELPGGPSAGLPGDAAVQCGKGVLGCLGCAPGGRVMHNLYHFMQCSAVGCSSIWIGVMTHKGRPIVEDKTPCIEDWI